MAWLVALTTLLAASAVLTESSFLRRAESGPTCPNLMSTCLMPNMAKHERLFRSEAAAVAVLSNRALLGTVAGDIVNASACIEASRAKPECANAYDDSEELAAIKLMAGYLDNSDHLDLMVAAASSPCLTSREMMESGAMSVLMCYMPLMEGVEMTTQTDPCQVILGLETCTVTTVESVCGQGAANLVQSLWTYMLQPQVLDTLGPLANVPSEMLAPLSTCGQQAHVVKRLAKRALDGVRK
ncbi:hypothetical protein EGW08_011542 [Elysia chlorotica]|uniref:Uncharacterized protein n=1 Tax=Elysia chlorotica TaxID=188477 RepID=A0A433TGR1_ELYCH|nr:hypothetical protein EGW08_011542 [Elysia chlorotica]